MPGRTYGVAIIGAGNIAAAHIYAVKGLSDVRLVGIASQTRARARQLADAQGVMAFRSVEEAVTHTDVDIVSICTPSGAHLGPALQAIAAGKHVVVEKPLEVTAERSRQLIDAADAAGLVVAAIFMSRFAPANAFAKSAVAEGRLGRILQADAYVKWWRDQAYYDSGAWRGTMALDGGGALMNQGIHQVDLLRWIAGPVQEVFAYAATLNHEGLEVEDTLVAVLRFENSAVGQISAATSLWPGRAKALHVHGTEGSLILEDDVLVDWQVRSGDEAERAALLGTYGGRGTGGSSDPMAISFENHRLQYQDLIDALDSGRAPAVDGREGIKAVELVEAIYASTRSGTPVRL
jgi:UDP-N-acetyl-2-amino-2-deoxyglucuronate dehydrogenase